MSDSPKIRAATKPGPKPSALRVAYSARRSRAVIAMVLATTAKMITITTNETMRMATMIVSVCAMKESWNDFSVSVRVSASEFGIRASIAWLISPRASRRRSG